MKPITTAGAPYALGHEQGRVLRDPIRDVIAAVRAQYGALTWRIALSQVHAGAGRRLQRFLPQVHERLEGIADGARVGARALELIGTQARVVGVGGSVKDGGIEARFEIPVELETALRLRCSRPDACGFPSAELTSVAWSGCLAGVNSEGVGVIVLEDRALDRPSLRGLAQDLIFRAQELGSGLEHLRRRAAYLGGTGRLLVVGSDGEAVDVRLARGELTVRPLPAAIEAPAESTVRIDPTRTTLEWTHPAGHTETLQPPT